MDGPLPVISLRVSPNIMSSSEMKQDFNQTFQLGYAPVHVFLQQLLINMYTKYLTTYTFLMSCYMTAATIVKLTFEK